MTRRPELALLLWLAGCAVDAAASRTPIVNGTPDTSSSAVVGMIHVRPDGTRQLCTGTVIAADVVLTAKHCVFENMGGSAWTAIPATDLFVYLGSDITAPDAMASVATITTTSGPYHSGDGAIGGDLALLTTATPLAGVTPLHVARTAPAISDAIHIVGFGYTVAGATGTLGTRHAGDATVSAVATGTFTTTGAQWTCTGDSGGPALDAAGDVIGVTSIGPAGCRTSSSIYTRLDQNLALVDSVVPPACVPAPEICNGLDDDCDGVVDPGCTDGGVTTDAGSADVDGGGSTGMRRGGCSVGNARADVTTSVLLITALGVLGVRRRRRDGARW